MEPAAIRVATKEIRTLQTIKQLIRDEQGAELVEYGLLAGLIALVAFASVNAFGRSVSSLYPQSIPPSSGGHALPF